MALPAPRSAAVQIVRPPPEFTPASSNAPLPGVTSPAAPRAGGNARIGRGAESPAPTSRREHVDIKIKAVSITILRPTNTNLSLPGKETGKLGAGLGAAAPAFIPKTPTVLASSPDNPAVPLQPWATQGSGGLLGLDTGSAAMQPGLSYEEGMMDQSLGMESLYLQQQHIRPPLDYNMYTQPLTSNTHPLKPLFIPDDVRRYLTSRNDAQWFPPTGSFPGLPQEVESYHSLAPLDPPRPPQGGQPHGHPGSRVYHHPAPVYRAQHTADGNTYVLRRIEGYKLVNEAAFGSTGAWREMRHPNIVGFLAAFTTKSFGDNSLVLVYDFHPDSTTVLEEHLLPHARPLTMGRRRAGMPIKENVLWSYIIQIASALKAIHYRGLAARNLDPSKVLITGRNRVRLNGCGIWDVLAYDPTTPVAVFQQEDLVSFGKLILSLGCEFYMPGNDPLRAFDHISRKYSSEVTKMISYLISAPSPTKSIDTVIGLLGPRILHEIDDRETYIDTLEQNLATELENARLVRLMSKLGFINERAEFELDPRWSDTGDRYILKLFRDYVFHSVGGDGRPILDMSHVVTCLNKLDAGLDEKIMLVSRDDQSCLVVNYRDIKTCIESAYNELRNSGNMMGSMMMGR